MFSLNRDDLRGWSFKYHSRSSRIYIIGNLKKANCQLFKNKVSETLILTNDFQAPGLANSEEPE